MTPRFHHNPRPMDAPLGKLHPANDNPRRGTIRLTLLIVGLFLAGTMAVVALDPGNPIAWSEQK